MKDTPPHKQPTQDSTIIVERSSRLKDSMSNRGVKLALQRIKTEGDRLQMSVNEDVSFLKRNTW